MEKDEYSLFKQLVKNEKLDDDLLIFNHINTEKFKEDEKEFGAEFNPSFYVDQETKEVLVVWVHKYN